MPADAGAARLAAVCADVRAGERVLVVCDAGTREVAEAVERAAGALSRDVELVEIPALAVHGAEPPADVASAMANAHVVFGLTAMSMAHTDARLRATEAGVRYLSLPDYTPALLAAPSLTADFRAITPLADAVAARFTAGRRLVLETADGSARLECDLGERVGNSAPGWCRGPGDLASPPDAEANIAPVEEGSQGTLVVDGSVPHPRLGPLDEPITATVLDGRIVSLTGGTAAEVLSELLDAPGDPAARVVAEIGAGLNPLAQLTGSMLEDEGCLGTVHVGIGANATIGGRNRVPSHIDLVVRRPTLTVDGERIIDKGLLVIET